MKTTTENGGKLRHVTMLAFLVGLAGCGGGSTAGASPTPPSPPPPPSAFTLSVKTTGAGQVTSLPAGLSCADACTASFDANTAVTLSAQPAANYALDSWSGDCTGANCAITLSKDATVTANFVPTVPVANAPYIHFTDTVSAPTHNGENGLGGYLSIFGINFGPATGLGSATKVFIGGVEVANYRYLGPAKVSGKLGLQQITVQVGSLGGAAAGTALPVKVVVNGVASNVGNLFTPTAGHVLFVSLTGNDGTAKSDDPAHPFRSLQNMSTLKGAYFTMAAGDQVVLRGGSWSDTTGVDTTWMRFGAGQYARNGKPNAWIHITAYPGPINGNAVEDVHYTTPAAASGGISGPWSSIAGTSGEYVAVSNLHFEISGGANRDAAPVNLQYTAGHWRVVNNEMGPWVTGSSAVINAGGVTGHGDGVVVLGNHIHDIAGTADLQNHGIYADTTAQNWEVAYNWIHDVTGGNHIQFNDNEGGAGTYVLPHGGTWQGFTGILIHHNWLENAAKYGVNFNDQQSTKAGAYDGRIWNNVIIGTQLPPLRINSTQPIQTLSFAFNTLYNDMTTSSATGNGYVRQEGWSDMAGVHNVFYDNIFAIGPRTTAGTQWFANVGGTSATVKTYDFKRNLYFANGQPTALPGTIGDTAAVVGDPLFTNVAGNDFSTQSASPARKGATQSLPSNFVVTDDITGMVARSPGASDLGAFSAP
jgi:hypothetical protein